MARLMDLEGILRGRELPPGVLLRGLPPPALRADHLVRQVMALANSDLGGQRALVFGVESGAGGAMVVAGLEPADVALLGAHRDACVAHIEPALDLTLVTGTGGGRTVAALVLGDCTDPPYVIGERAPSPLRAGECWLFDTNRMRYASRADLDAMYATRRQRRAPPVLVGLGDDPGCELLEVVIPAVGAPPSRMAAAKLRAAIAARRSAAAVIGHDDSRLARLAHARIFGADAPYRPEGIDTLVRALRAVPESFRDADRHYRLEQCAVRLDLNVLNRGATPLAGAVLELLVPAVAGLDVVSQPCPAPGQPPPDDAYPEVRRERSRYRVRSALGTLDPGVPTAAFATPLRLLAGTELAGRKVALRYTLTAVGLNPPREGRVRLRFRR
jgi:hypothetical protein